MEPLSIHLKPPARHAAPVLCCSIAMVALAVWFGELAHLRHEAGMAARHRADRLRAARVVLPVAVPTPAELAARKRWRDLLVERSFAWPSLFAAVERAAGPDIELLEFLPEKGNLRVSLRGQARDQPALTNFLEALARQAVLARVHLVHQEKVARDRLETIEFEIRASITR